MSPTAFPVGREGNLPTAPSWTPGRWPVREAATALAVSGLLGSLLVLLQYIYARPEWSTTSVTLVALGAAIFGFMAFGMGKGGGLFGFAGVYFIYLCLAHLGMAGVALWTEEGFGDLTPSQLAWFYMPERDLATAISGAAIATFALGALGVGALRRAQASTAMGFAHRGQPLIHLVGLGLLVLCSVYFVVAVLTGALPLGGQYDAYRAAMERLWTYPYVIGFFSIGATFAFATGDRRAVARALALMAVPVFLLMAAGNRGEFLYPLAALVAILYIRGFRVRVRTLAAVGILFLVLITLVGATRSEGVENATADDLKVSPTAPFVELGYQLRPLTWTVTWIEQGEPHANGDTYRVPTQRLAGIFMPWLERPPLDDPKLDLKARLPTQGYSVVAEAYFNFGMVGVLLAFPALGGALVWMHSRCASFAALAAGSAILAILINNIRNVFLFVPAQVLSVLLLAGIAMLPGTILRNESSRIP